LITWLSQRGYVCVATEITSERGKALAPDSSNIAWHVSDGINLARFELPFSYDAVISTQVLEHFHPDDLAAHLAGVRAILVPGGRYIFTTPHTYMGPTDLSRIFGLPYPVCQHLKEYRYRDLMGPLHEAGFARVRAFYTLPAPIVRRFPRLAKAWLGESYLGALLRAERVLDHLPEAIRSQVVKVLRLLMLWRPDICIVAETPPAAMEQLAAASD
jgi:SAM-dependent methyltransferase